MGIPTIVFDLTGVVYYINSSLRTLTGFFRNIPSSRDDFLFYNVCIFFYCLFIFFIIFFLNINFYYFIKIIIVNK